MFCKNNLKHILIIALGFFSCSAIYLTLSTILSNYTSVDFANKVSAIYANLAMALGIFLFAIIYKKTKNIKKYYILSMLLYLISLILFLIFKNTTIMSILLCLCCLFSTSGFSAGYHFAMLPSNIEQKYFGKVFSIGYATASLLTYFITFLPSNIYASSISLFLYIPIILINLILVIKQNNLNIIKKEKPTKDFKKYILSITIIIILMAILSSISTDVIPIYNYNMKDFYTYSRIYYSIGLIVAGIICDKNKELFDTITITSFVYYLISLVLLNQNVSPSIVIAISFFFLGFFVIFRTTIFMNISANNKNYLYICAYGLAFSRIIEGIISKLENIIISNYLILILVEAILLGLILIIYFLSYMKNNNKTKDDKLKELSLKSGLSIQEEKVLVLLMQDLTNQEIADKLFVSINTVRNHVASIYKKTGMKKQELRGNLHSRTN